MSSDPGTVSSSSCAVEEEEENGEFLSKKLLSGGEFD